MTVKTKIISGNLLVLAGFVADRVIKYLMIQKFPDREFLLLGNWLKLKLAYNTGVAFGVPLNSYLILAAYLAILLAMVILISICYRRRQLSSAIVFSFIFVGGFSNLIDRLKFGQVIDYFDLRYYSVFNLADAMIVVGVLVVIALNWKKKKELI